MKTLLYNCGEVAHLSTGDDEYPLSGNRLLDRSSLVYPPGIGIIIDSGVIVKIEPMQELVAEFAPWYPTKNEDGEIKVIDVEGMSVVPGFVDSHTHLVWSGDRSNELSMRISGKSYKEIAQSGGGIMKTVNSTRSAPQKQLVNSGIRRLETALRSGTTSLEAKSGYGLDLNSEVKLLEAISDIGRTTPCDVCPTWLGAHDFPPEMSQSQYVEHLISEQLPVISELSLAKWVDVFCEEGWFTNEQTEDIVTAAKSFGLDSRLHVDEFVDSGGLQLASDLGSVSADHVSCSNDDSRISAAESGTVQTFLPGTPYVLGKELDLPIKKCIEEDWPFSLATDFNPGTCTIRSLTQIMLLAILNCGMSLEESFKAITFNAAKSLMKNNEIGTIEENSKADLLFWNINSLNELVYGNDANGVKLKKIMKNGNFIN